MVLELRKATKNYGTNKVLDDVSFRIDKPGVTGILGPNGAGKSTCFKAICGLLPLSSGQIYVHERDQNREESSSSIGFLPEHNPLYNNMYVKENLLFFSRLNGLKKPMTRVNEVVEATSLQEVINKRIKNLSKGFKQRVGIAQALLHDPDILILDEPINGLDPGQIEQIRSLFIGLGKSKIVLYSTHIMQEVEAICDRVIMLDHGKVVADGHPENLFSNHFLGSHLFLEFKNPLSLQDLQDSFASCSFEQEEGHSKRILVRCADKRDLREEIFKWAVFNNKVLLEMRPIQSSLNQSFLKMIEVERNPSIQ